MTSRPWKALRTPFHAPEARSETRLKESPPPRRAPLPSIEVDLSELDALAQRPVAERLLGPGEKATWESRALLAFDMAAMRERFSKEEVDAVIAEAEARGMAFTKSGSHIVVFNGASFTLTRNDWMTRMFFKVDSLLRRLAK